MKPYRVTLHGDSMLPTLKSGAGITMSPISGCTRKDVKVGDIVLYRSKGYNRDGKHTLRYLFGENACHRIIEKREEYAVLKGDNREYTENVPYHAILAKCELDL